MDLNSDVGEGYGAWPAGPDADLLDVVTSANVACGFHAGDPSLLRATCALAVRRGVAIGAQVGYPDLVGFGRRFLDMARNDLRDAVVYQVGALGALAGAEGGRVNYVKPHGALYHAVARHDEQAAAVAEAAVDCGGLPLLGLADSALEAAAHAAGLRFVAEGFADRAYAADGSLVPRREPGALITDPARAAAQAVRLADGGVVSICVHSDTPGAPTIARAVAEALRAAGHPLRPFAS